MTHSSMSSSNSKPLKDGKKYHYFILYNYYEGPQSRRQGDHLLSSNFLKALEEKLCEEGYDKVMYHDKVISGRSIFHDIFHMVEESGKIVVLLTPEFLHDGWKKYTEQATIKNLLDKQEAHTRFIPIAINMEPDDIPYDLGLSVSKIIYTGYENNEADEGVWERVLEAIDQTEIHYEQNRKPDAELCVPNSAAQIKTSQGAPTIDLNDNDIDVDGPHTAVVDGDRSTDENVIAKTINASGQSVDDGTDHSPLTNGSREDGDITFRSKTFSSSATTNSPPQPCRKFIFARICENYTPKSREIYLKLLQNYCTDLSKINA
ncbi:hypothetical protein LOTGIDRAFT_159088 [Lottia gigantea]|uniref:TIR domain-containing protein n=1 Tax=Lottia gigantea TaxID=225164 RepID=V4AXI8_LOTGI|nr:hypothetical protein LOTGIDRAFT_159088 [Lottia gigantea]ESO98291.1 hypothetical protein LOTGIDRAFT_159088 [Lottia gigantea]